MFILKRSTGGGRIMEAVNESAARIGYFTRYISAENSLCCSLTTEIKNSLSEIFRFVALRFSNI